MEETQIKPLVIYPKFEVGAIVFLIHDPEQQERMVVQYIVSRGEIVYTLSCGTATCNAYDFEIAESKKY